MTNALIINVIRLIHNLIIHKYIHIMVLVMVKLICICWHNFIE